MFFAQLAEKVVPVVPPLPKMPDLAAADGLLLKLKAAVDAFSVSTHQINSGLFITGLWVGVVTGLCIWFVVDRLRSKKDQPAK